MESMNRVCKKHQPGRVGKIIPKLGDINVCITPCSIWFGTRYLSMAEEEKFASLQGFKSMRHLRTCLEREYGLPLYVVVSDWK